MTGVQTCALPISGRHQKPVEGVDGEARPHRTRGEGWVRHGLKWRDDARDRGDEGQDRHIVGKGGNNANARPEGRPRAGRPSCTSSVPGVLGQVLVGDQLARRERIERTEGLRAHPRRVPTLPRPHLGAAGEEPEADEVRATVAFPEELARALIEGAELRSEAVDAETRSLTTLADTRSITTSTSTRGIIVDWEDRTEEYP